MTTMARWLALLIVFALFTPAAQAAAPVQGWWYQEGVEDGRAFQYIIERRDDGSFTAKIRTVNECKFGEPWVETGHWEYRDGTLFNTTESTGGQKVDGRSPEYRDSFRVTVIDADHHTSHDLETEIEFLETRVDADFQFPTPKACTS